MVLGLSLSLWSATARAESDGYYCLGPDYLAYEFRFSDGGEGHRLFIQKFGPEGPDPVVGVLAIDDFQVHDLQCSGEAIELVDDTEAVTVVLSPDRQPVDLQKTAVTPCGANCPELPSLGFGVFAGHAADVPFTSKPLLLVSESSCGYLLNAARQQEPSDGALRETVTVDLVWRCQASGTRGARRLFRGTQIAAPTQ